MKNLFFPVIIFCVMAFESNGQVSVIANKSIPDNTVSPSALSEIYSLSNVKWSSGIKIVVYEQASESDIKSKFYSYISKEPLALKKEWLKKQFSGEAKAPETVPSDDEMIKKVSSTPGAIGYVKSSSVNESVKVLAEIK